MLFIVCLSCLSRFFVSLHSESRIHCSCVILLHYFHFWERKRDSKCKDMTIFELLCLWCFVIWPQRTYTVRNNKLACWAMFKPIADKKQCVFITYCLLQHLATKTNTWFLFVCYRLCMTLLIVIRKEGRNDCNNKVQHEEVKTQQRSLQHACHTVACQTQHYITGKLKAKPRHKQKAQIEQQTAEG